MGGPPAGDKSIDSRASELIRRASAAPASRFFRVFNFELYSRRVRLVVCGDDSRRYRGSAFVAVPGTLLFLGVLASMAMTRSDAESAARVKAGAVSSAEG
jgi:hypothetical protein